MDFLHRLKEQWRALTGESRPLGPFRTMTHGRFLESLESRRIYFFYDGNGRRALENLAPLHRRARHSLVARRFLQDPYIRTLQRQNAEVKTEARRYPEFVYSFILLDRELILLYPSAFRQRIHALAIPLSAEKFSRLKERLFDFHRSSHGPRQVDGSGNRSAVSRDQVSEVSFRKLRLRKDLRECYDRKQIEFACRGRTKASLRTEDALYSARLDCAEGSTILLQRNPAQVINYLEDSEEMISIPYVQEGITLRWNTPPKKQSHEATPPTSGSDGFWSAAPCRNCNSLGFPEQRQGPEIPSCTVEDLVLSEINAKGVLDANGSMKPGGKFLEWSVRRTCKPGSLRLKVDDRLLMLPARRIKAGIFLLLADASFFLPPDNVVWNENYLLRRLSEDSQVQLLDVRTGNVRSYGKTDATSDQGKTKLSRKHVMYGQSRLAHPLRSIHSRVPAKDAFLLHPPRCKGLLVDFCPYHGMSPGYTNPGIHIPQLALDEVLPVGPAGHPRMEFLEWRARANKGKEGPEYAAAEMEIELSSRRREYRFTIPVPENVNARFALMGKREYCFSNSSGILESQGFRIPNEPFSIKTTLRSLRTDGVLEERIVDRHRFTRAHSRVRSRLRANNWFLHAGSGPCEFASPGKPGYYRPRLEPAGIHELDLHWFSSEPAQARLTNLKTGAVSVTWLQPGKNLRSRPVGQKQERIPFLLEIQGFNPSGPLMEGGPNLSAGVPEYSRSRFVLWKRPAGPEDPVCQFSDVSAGSREWVRICFPGGSDQENTFAFMDEQSTDIMVPARTRRPGLPDPQSASRTIFPGGCALLLDPDLTDSEIQEIQNSRDELWLMPESGSALGNGLRPDESLILKDSDGMALCTFRMGLPENKYPIPDSGLTGRKGDTVQDIPENFRSVEAPVP